MTASATRRPRNDPVERLRQRATAMTDTGAALKKLADATEPLYKSLDDSQKRRFAVLNRLTGMGMTADSSAAVTATACAPPLGPAPHRRRPDGLEHSGEQRL